MVGCCWVKVNDNFVFEVKKLKNPIKIGNSHSMISMNWALKAGLYISMKMWNYSAMDLKLFKTFPTLGYFWAKSYIRLHLLLCINICVIFYYPCLWKYFTFCYKILEKLFTKSWLSLTSSRLVINFRYCKLLNLCEIMLKSLLNYDESNFALSNIVIGSRYQPDKISFR